jgi:hypothetical protein
MARLTGLSLVAFAFLAAIPVHAAEQKPTSALAAFQGAWVQPSTECAEVFVESKRGMAFKKPVSIFAPALLIIGRRISTPGAVCTVRSSSASGDRQALDLSCATAIATDPVKTLLSIAADGALYRYNKSEDNGTRYVRCGH